MHRYIQGVLDETGDIIENDFRQRKEKLFSSQRTRAVTYRQMNPDLVVHPIYSSSDIVEDDRIHQIEALVSSLAYRNRKVGKNTSRATVVPVRACSTNGKTRVDRVCISR